MNVAPIRSILEFAPDGKTTDELYRKAVRAGISTSKLDVVEALTILLQDDVVVLGVDRRWKLASYASSVGRAPEQDSQPGPEQTGSLNAVFGRFRNSAKPTFDVDDTDAGVESGPDLQKLLSYYEATLRTDPRGAATQYADRHGQQFQLFFGRGPWWPTPDEASTIEFNLDTLPATFREALSRRDDNESLAIGYPLDVVETTEGTSIIPVGLIGAEREDRDGILRLQINDTDISLNPDWLKLAVTRTPWNGRDLSNRIIADEEINWQVFASRISECVATLVRGKLNPTDLLDSLSISREGISNAAAIFLPTDQQFTKGAAADLAKLSQMNLAALEGTALSSCIGQTLEDRNDTSVLHSLPLTINQYEAAKSGLAEPLTVVTGPPGTGKSQVIVSIMTSALAAGKTVLFASRNHKAVDAVEERLNSVTANKPVIVRAYDPSTERDTNFVKIVGDILKEGKSTSVQTTPSAGIQRLIELDDERRMFLAAWHEQQKLSCELSEFTERRSLLQAELSRNSVGEEPVISDGLLYWILRFLRRLFRRGKQPIPAAGANLKQLQEEIERISSLLAKARLPSGDPVEISLQITAEMEKRLPSLVENAFRIPSGLTETLHQRQKDRELSGKQGIDQVDGENAREILQVRPIWAVSTLAAPARIPLELGLFDYVIFDEASQCDIASAIPLLARAKSAVIVGDPQQLTFIRQLSTAKERALFTAVGLSGGGLGQYAQSLNSLFDFAASRKTAKRIMLRDQFRSAPTIVDYLNEEFYDNGLRVSVDENNLKIPPQQKPGIHWTDVAGRAFSDGSSGSSNKAEAEAIAAHLKKLLVDQNYLGSIGIISPFVQQVALIRKLVNSSLNDEQIQNTDLKIDTVDRFQGGECDLVLFSPVAAQGLPVGSLAFLVKERRRFNVAVSRARAVCHIFGNLEYAKSNQIKHLGRLARFAMEPRRRRVKEDVFDSKWERRVDVALRKRGLKPKPQYPIAGRFLDFALFGKDELKLDLEVDGRQWHMDADGNRKIADLQRDHQLKSLGWRVRRFWVHELEQNMEQCLDRVERDLAGEN